MDELLERRGGATGTAHASDLGGGRPGAARRRGKSRFRLTGGRSIRPSRRPPETFTRPLGKTRPRDTRASVRSTVGRTARIERKHGDPHASAYLGKPIRKTRRSSFRPKSQAGAFGWEAHVLISLLFRISHMPSPRAGHRNRWAGQEHGALRGHGGGRALQPSRSLTRLPDFLAAMVYQMTGRVKRYGGDFGSRGTSGHRRQPLASCPRVRSCPPRAGGVAAGRTSIGVRAPIAPRPGRCSGSSVSGVRPVRSPSPGAVVRRPGRGRTRPVGRDPARRRRLAAVPTASCRARRREAGRSCGQRRPRPVPVSRARRPPGSVRRGSRGP
ncbi:hypothetical protein SUDANB6_05620 [Streptomyces sp. enrichment culture]